ncbi:hypothetical protein FACS1894170_10090 [Planctomycetales bacterium]|nr:hypothetical protein FACS1894170_10090 [Planctomycetales bacterium]
MFPYIRELLLSGGGYEDGGVAYFHNISGDIPRANYEHNSFTVPGVNGTGVQVLGQRFPDAQFTGTGFFANYEQVITCKNTWEGMQMKYVRIQNSIGEFYAPCLLLEATIQPAASTGVLGWFPNIALPFQNPPEPTWDTPENIVECHYRIDINFLIRFLFSV